MSDESRADAPPRPLRQKLPKPVLGKDFVVICISTYPRELEKLDGLVLELKREGHRKMNRSALIRLAIDRLYQQRMAELGGPDAAE